MSSFIVMDIVKEAEKFEDCIHFEIGQPDLPPSPKVKEALHVNIDANKFSYTQSHGLIALRQKIAQHYAKTYGVHVDIEQIFLTPGTSGAFLIAYALTLGKDATLGFSDPSYPCYKNFAYLLDIKPLFMPIGKEDNFELHVKDLEAQREAIQNLENAGANSSSNKDFDGDTFSPTVAKMNEFNPDLLLPKGTYIGCSLDTRFVSAIQGSTSCTVSQNIYSSNGNVLLIEKGSKLFGTYKGDNANDGTSRYFVVWQEVRTPNHLRIPLNSGSSDELGGAGLEGEIDHKWMMRFGSSIMLSMVDDIFNVLAYKMTNKNGGSNSGNQIDYTENTRDNASNIASIALEKFINIKPTVYKQHGDLVGVYVNRDVDFSKVYKISRKK